MNTLFVRPGTYKLIRADGTEALISQKPTIRGIEQLLKAELIDTVNLRVNETVMMLDDLGHDKQLPVNPSATRLYLSVCKPGVTHQIRGDVVLVNDADF